MGAHEGQKATSVVIPQPTFTLFWEQSFSLAWNSRLRLTWLARDLPDSADPPSVLVPGF